MGLLALASACGDDSGPQTGDEVTLSIGVVIDRSGPQATSSWAVATEEAVAAANAALAESTTFSHIRFDILTGDTQGLDEQAKSNASEVMASGAKGLILQSSSESGGVASLNYDADTTNDVPLPIICGACPSGSLNDPEATNSDPDKQAGYRDADNWIFRVLAPNSVQADVLFKELVLPQNNCDINGDGQFKVSIYSNASGGGGTRRALKGGAETFCPGAIVETDVRFNEEADPNTYDFNGDIARLADNVTEGDTDVTDVPADMIVDQAVGAFAVGAINAHAALADPKPIFYHVDQFRTQTVIDQGGTTAEGHEGISRVSVENTPSGNAFANRFQSATGQAPALGDASYFDATTLMLLGILHAIQTNGLVDDPAAVTGAQVRASLEQLNAPGGTTVSTDGFLTGADAIGAGTPIDYEGASGPCDFDDRGNVSTRVVHFRVQDAAFVDLTTYDCVASPDCPAL